MSIGNGAPAWPSVIVSNGRISRSEHISGASGSTIPGSGTRVGTPLSARHALSTIRPIVAMRITRLPSPTSIIATAARTGPDHRSCSGPSYAPTRRSTPRHRARRVISPLLIIHASHARAIARRSRRSRTRRPGPRRHPPRATRTQRSPGRSHAPACGRSRAHPPVKGTGRLRRRARTPPAPRRPVGGRPGWPVSRRRTAVGVPASRLSRTPGAAHGIPRDSVAEHDGQDERRQRNQDRALQGQIGNNGLLRRRGTPRADADVNRRQGQQERQGEQDGLDGPCPAATGVPALGDG